MLKTFRGLALGLVVLVGSAYVTPTYASSTSVLITNVQPGTFGRPYDEHVLLYNTTSEDVDITDWCLTNKSGKEFACFSVDRPDEAFIIRPYSYALVVSEYKATTLQDESQYSLAYIGNSLTSSSIVASSDTISLVDNNNEEIDSVSWFDSTISDLVYSRLLLDSPSEVIYIDTGTADDWSTTVAFTMPSLGAELRTVVRDYNISLRINELLANVTGPDAGKEYIELYNFGEEPYILSDFTLLVGKSLDETIQLPDAYIEPGRYIVIQNDTYDFSLLNTQNRVALSYGSVIIDETEYSNPKDDMSWSLIDDVWQYTNQMTPGLENEVSIATAAPTKSAKKSALKPCASNQYRHPETSRCRLINPSTSKSMPKPCAANQFRNPETGRCKLVSTASSAPKPCKEGQERNPETNRCRNIKKMTTVDYGVVGAKTEPSKEEAFQLWLLGAAAGLGIVVYGVWEWRQDIARLWRALGKRFARQHK